jgi:peptidoglycan/LPS O-acetylase OafA/YrhL
VWVTVFIGLGLFQRSSDLIVASWLCISLLNELTYDFPWIGKLLLADYSGFFATGILIYQLHKGRRDLWLQGLLAASVATAVFQAIHNLRWLRAQTGETFDEFSVAAIFLGSVLVILLATRIRSLPIRPGVVVAIGGTTYPFYLLHQQFGYVIFQKVGPAAEPLALVLAIVVSVFAISWATWRFVERPAQRFTKQTLTGLAAGISVYAASRSRELSSNL